MKSPEITLCAAVCLWLSLLLPGLSISAEDLPRYDGLIEPNEVVNVGSPVRGVVENVYVERSTIVNKGDVLIQMESSVERVMVERAKVLAEASGEIKIQREKHKFSSRAQARMQELFDSEAISSQAKDKAETEEAVAKFSLQKAEENRLLAEMDLKRTKALLELRTIRSPLAGVVVERFVSPGEFIDEQPLLKIAELDPLKVEVIVPAELFGTIKTGDKAKVYPNSSSGGDVLATVTIVDKIIDAASNTFGIRLKLPNPDYKLAGGLRCQVQFLLSGYESVSADSSPEPR